MSRYAELILVDSGIEQDPPGYRVPFGVRGQGNGRPGPRRAKGMLNVVIDAKNATHRQQLRGEKTCLLRQLRHMRANHPQVCLRQH